MRRNKVKNIVLYYKNIPDMVKFERKQQSEIENEYYNGIRGLSTDGMVYGGAPGKPTEKMGIRAAENNRGEALAEIQVRIKILEADARQIRECIDMMNSKYKMLIFWKLIHGYSWPKISTQFCRPESTCRSWYDKALDRLGEILENDILMVDELVQRATRAR